MLFSVLRLLCRLCSCFFFGVVLIKPLAEKVSSGSARRPFECVCNSCTSSPCSRMRRTKITWMAFPMLASWKIPATWRRKKIWSLELRVKKTLAVFSSCWPCSWWWRCRTRRFRFHDILSAWSRPPPWSPPSAPYWQSAPSGPGPTALPPAAPAPIPHAPSRQGPSCFGNLQQGKAQKSRWLHTCGFS